MGEFPGCARSAYLGLYECSATHNLSTCRSDTPILGSGNVRLYPLDTVPTHPCRAIGFAVRGSKRGELSSCMFHWRTT